MSAKQTNYGVPSQNVFAFDSGISFSSNFDNGNLAKVVQGSKPYDFKIWTAPDSPQAKSSAWFYFCISGLPQGCALRIQVINTSNHAGLYKYDMVSGLWYVRGNWTPVRLSFPLYVVPDLVSNLC
jgi:hypothetical protein